MDDAQETQSDSATPISRRNLIRNGLMAAAACTGLERGWGQIGSVLPDAGRTLISKMSASLLGDGPGALLSGVLIDALGLGSHSTNYEAYFAAIEQKLDKLDVKLDYVGKQLELLHTDVDHLQTEVLSVAAAVNSLGIQDVIREVNRNVTVVSGQFDLYRAAIDSLNSSDSADRASAGQQLYSLFSPGSAEAISIAMTNIQEQFLPQNFSEAKGMQEYQLQLLEARLKEVASRQDDFRIAPAPPVVVGISYSVSDVPNDEGYFNAGAMVTKAHEQAAAYLNASVAEAMTVFVKAQLQGMLMLSAAWEKSINAGQLATHTARNRTILAGFAAFPQVCKARVDDAVAQNLRTFGKRLGHPITSDTQTTWIRGTFLQVGPPPRPWRGENMGVGVYTGYQLSDDYIMWGRSPAKSSVRTIRDSAPQLNVIESYLDVLVLVERPWEYESCQVISLSFATASTPFYSSVSRPNYQESYLGQMTVPRFDQTTLTKMAFVQKLK